MGTRGLQRKTPLASRECWQAREPWRMYPGQQEDIYLSTSPSAASQHPPSRNEAIRRPVRRPGLPTSRPGENISVPTPGSTPTQILGVRQNLLEDGRFDEHTLSMGPIHRAWDLHQENIADPLALYSDSHTRDATEPARGRQVRRAHLSMASTPPYPWGPSHAG